MNELVWSPISQPAEDDPIREGLHTLASGVFGTISIRRPDPTRWDLFQVFWIHSGQWHVAEVQS